jgi:hypothetical protein
MQLTSRQLHNFWSKVDVRDANSCWPWLGGTDRRGYGLISLNNKSYRAPRISILLATGVMPDPRCDACHSCDNPVCVNPYHLVECTRQKNMQDAHKRGRLRNWKQKLTPDLVREIRSAEGRLKDIATQHGLDPSTVSKIRSRKIWKDIH